ncbi:MAG TPA: 16S rRNA (cytidine(1402)-2'-O)-methyltransferase [Pyrinomonadaceae bacterium]|nr:16S rRNA (cytidine(1402)-2'-O)-methyltransferase [Pyrinomonadaceae bacterium]
MAGSLYIVSTPIGNLDDITHRALEVLRQITVIACEDTRHTRKLLNHFGINTPTISYHDHNERERAIELLGRLKSGDSIAIVSDAGTPGINDPGFRLVRLAIENDVQVTPVPGASALISALVSSGLPTDEFFFGGFLPPKSNARRSRLEQLRSIAATLIFYEAPHRIAATLKDGWEVLGNRTAVVARELTKLHEEFVRGDLRELVEHFSAADKARGEMVLMISGKSDEDAVNAEGRVGSVAALVAELEAAGLDHRAALKKAARTLGMTRDEAYRRLIVERGSN